MDDSSVSGTLSDSSGWGPAHVKLNEVIACSMAYHRWFVPSFCWVCLRSDVLELQFWSKMCTDNNICKTAVLETDWELCSKHARSVVGVATSFRITLFSRWTLSKYTEGLLINYSMFPNWDRCFYGTFPNVFSTIQWENEFEITHLFQLKRCEYFVVCFCWIDFSVGLDWF